jgi:XTP/dITP diphosphohydrolase
VIADSDEAIVRECRSELGSLGVEVLSLADVGFPEPRTRPSDTSPIAAAVKATVIASFAGHPAIGFAGSFGVDAMQLWGGIDCLWRFPDPWPHPMERLTSELWAAHKELVLCGHLGPDDRNAYWNCVACLARTNGVTQRFDATARGQLAWTIFDQGGPAEFADCFVPDGERKPLAKLQPVRQAIHSPRRRVIRRLGKALREAR